MFVRSRGVWFGFAEKMFMFCSGEIQKTCVLANNNIYEQWLVITASWEDLAAVVFVSNKFMSSCVQYVVLSPRLKVINLNILPESSRDELKYSLNIAFMFLSIIRCVLFIRRLSKHDHVIYGAAKIRTSRKTN